MRPEIHSSGFGPTICSQTAQDLEDVKSMGTNVGRFRSLMPDKPIILGLYMWDFDAHAPVSAARMEQQLAFARRFLADRTVTGLIFHPSFAAALGVSAVKLAKAWIASCGDDLWGV